jgi:hypothetical protein
MNVPHATVVKGDSCAVGPEDKVIHDFMDSHEISAWELDIETREVAK